MTSWAVVCDVYFLEPQTKSPGETSQHFAERVQKLIAQRANLHIAPWDGYLKYYNLGDKVMPVTKVTRWHAQRSITAVCLDMLLLYVSVAMQCTPDMLWVKLRSALRWTTACFAI